MLFLIKNFLREMKCYIKTFWCFLLLVLIGCFFLLNIRISETMVFSVVANKILVKLIIAITLWYYVFWGKYPLLLMNPANYIYRDWHKNNILLIINYVFKSISSALLLYIIIKTFFDAHFEVLLVQSILLNQISFLVKWKIYHEEKINKISVFIMILNTILYVSNSIYFGIIAGLLGCTFLVARLPRVNMNKYYNDLKFIYANKNVMIRGDYSGAARIADEYNSRKEYTLTLRREYLKQPIIGKSIFIDTLRASAGRWIIKIVLLLLMVILEIIKWDSSNVMNFFSFIILNGLCLLIVNDYFFYAKQLVDSSKKGLFLPISSIKLVLHCQIIPSVFISLIYILYCSLNSCSIITSILAILFNIIINFLHYITVFVNKNKRRLLVLALNALRVGGTFYLFMVGEGIH